jgi:hypothetical protein
MKALFIIPLLFFSLLVFAQSSQFDSLKSNMPTEVGMEKATHDVDSIKQSFYQRSDSLKTIYKNKFTTLDSIQSRFLSRLDSIENLSFAPVTKLDSMQRRLQGKMDSLSLRLSSSKISKALDSVRTLRDSLVANLNTKIQAIKSKTIGKLNSMDIPPELKDKVSSVTQSVNSFKINGKEVNLSGLNTSAANIPGLENLNLSSTGALPSTGKIPDIGNVKGLQDVAEKTGSLNTALPEMGLNNVNEIKDLPAAAETKAVELSGLNQTKEQTEALNKYKEMTKKFQNPDSMKSLAKEEIKKAAVNHFAGKEEQLKKAMETISKYKLKYSSINSLADIKKRPPNAMKGKPLRERIIPGVAMQIQKKGDDFMVDFNPYVGYRFSGRITAGLGWNQRVAYDLDVNSFNPDARVFGPRLYGEFKLGKGFSPRLEGEVMNTRIPPSTVTPSADPGQREWVWGAFVGMKKEYKLFKNVKGTAMIMTRLFNPDHKSPYADVLNIRFGFEFPMKKKTPALK